MNSRKTLQDTNPYLSDPDKRDFYIQQSCTTSGGVEGIKHRTLEDDLPEQTNYSEPLYVKFLDPTKSKHGKLDLASPALHPDFVTLLAEVASVSVEKGYRPLNWLDPKNKVTTLKLISAAERHLQKVKKGIDINDEEKKLDGSYCQAQPLHLACAAYGLLMAAVQIREGIVELDDRVFKDGRVK